MAATLTSIRADRTNRARLVFDASLDLTALELGSGALTPSGPELIRFEEVEGTPTELLAVFDRPFERVSYSFAFSGLVDAAAAAVSGSGSFLGIVASSPRRFAYDRRLRIDLGLSVTPGGDLGLLAGEAFLVEQVERVLSWEKGALLVAPTFGRPWRKNGPLRSSELAAFKRDAEKTLRELPGVRGAQVSLRQAGDVLTVRAQVRTDQAQTEVSAQRIQGV